MLQYAADKYKLGDQDKALRCILDYIATDLDWDEIFQKIRFIRCGPYSSWSPPDIEESDSCYVCNYLSQSKMF